MNSAQHPSADIGALSVEQFCHWAGIGRTKVYEEIDAGRLEAKKFGRRTIIPLEAAKRWLAALPPVRVCKSSERSNASLSIVANSNTRPSRSARG